MSRESDARIIGKVIARAWRDEGFKKRFVANPMEVLKEEGMRFPDPMPRNWKISVVLDTPQESHIVIPVKPRGLPADEEEVFGPIQCCGAPPQ
jgi:hypothetical protein